MKLPIRSRMGLAVAEVVWLSFGRSPSPDVLRGDKKSVDWRRRTSELSEPANNYSQHHTRRQTKIRTESQRNNPQSKERKREGFSSTRPARRSVQNLRTFFSASPISLSPTGS